MDTKNEGTKNFGALHGSSADRLEITVNGKRTPCFDVEIDPFDPKSVDRRITVVTTGEPLLGSVGENVEATLHCDGQDIPMIAAYQTFFELPPAFSEPPLQYKHGYYFQWHSV